MSRPRGVVLYEGPSLINDAPIVVLVAFESGNIKTGNMLQAVILRRDVAPLTAIKNGADISICGDCVHRSDGSCYVVVMHGPRAMYGAYRRGRYSHDQSLLPRRPLRIGMYGDPTAVPVSVWERALEATGPGHTGYTARWDIPENQSYKSILMASAPGERSRDRAHALGWRTFRVEAQGSDPALAYALARDEIVCPNSTRGVLCIDCGICDGAGPAQSIVVEAHGARAKKLRVLA